MRRLTIPLLATVLLVLGGCGTKEPNPDPDQLKSECTIDGQEAPRWVCGLHHDAAYYAAVGTARKSKLGFGFMRTSALADARANLAQQAALDVKAKTTRFARSTGLGEAETVKRVVEGVTDQASRVTLRDSWQKAYWENPADGSIYVLVVADRKKVYDAAKKAIVSSFRNDEALWQQFQAKEALKALNETFETK